MCLQTRPDKQPMQQHYQNGSGEDCVVEATNPNPADTEVDSSPIPIGGHTMSFKQTGQHDDEIAAPTPTDLRQDAQEQMTDQQNVVRTQHNSHETGDSVIPVDDQVSRQIEYVYLDWKTEVVKIPIFPDGLQAEIPAFPDLRRFDNPFEWTPTRKWVVTYVSCVTNMAAAYAAGSYAAPEKQLTELWGISRVAFNVGITVFTVGFGIGPMILAPFSEINGRRPVFITAGVVFVICQLGSALTQSYGGMLAARFWAGIAGSTFSTMVGGILADIWVSSERNTPMVLLTGSTLFGTGLGPLCSGFVAQNLLWRWVFYIQVVFAGTLMLLVAIFFKETRGPILLARRARALNRWYEAIEACGVVGMDLSQMQASSHEPEKESSSTINSESRTLTLPAARRIRYKVLAEEQRASLLRMISLSLYRPAHLLVTEPVVICFSIWIAFSWSILYLQFGSIPLVFATNHNFSLQETGAVFTAVSVGGIISTWLSVYQDTWAVKRFGAKFTGTPEGRLWFTCLESLLMPIGMLWFGWTCYTSIHWIVPTLALVAVTMGIFSVFLATYNYLADVYQTYASSALAAAGVCRNFLAGSFPLVTVQMFNGMGFQAASSLLAGIGFLLSLGPILLIFFGPRIRARSKIASQFLESGS